VSDPLARFARVSPHEGEIKVILPLREGESRRRRQGVAHTPSGINPPPIRGSDWMRSAVTQGDIECL